MKSLRLFFLTVFLSGVFAAQAQQGVNFESGDYFQVLKLAREQDRPVFIEFGVHCGYCYKMKKEVFSDERVGKFYNENFINLIVDERTPIGRDFGERFNGYSYPTYFYLDPDGNIIHIAANYKSPDKIIKEGRKALSAKTYRPFGVWWNKLKTRNKQIYSLFNTANQAFVSLVGLSGEYSDENLGLSAFSNLQGDLSSANVMVNKSLEIEEYYFNTFVAALVYYLDKDYKKAVMYAEKALYAFPHHQGTIRKGVRDKLLKELIRESRMYASTN